MVNKTSILYLPLSIRLEPNGGSQLPELTHNHRTRRELLFEAAPVTLRVVAARQSEATKQ
ncbi:MAG TPA: hypothetical protein VGU64_21415 [Terriglobales bacterium]|nr:hypothetical protein [Terriglobales bacterium]